MNLEGKISDWLLYGTVLFLTTLIFHYNFGLGIVHFQNYGWLMLLNSDAAPDFLAWEYYRTTPWSFPIGKIQNYSYPLETSIGLTGGLPIFAIPFKLFSSILPSHFQFFGLWLLSCYYLQVIFGIKLLKLFVKDNFFLIIGALLFLLSPAFLDRIGHINLCCHWAILAGLWIYFSSEEMSFRRKFIYHILVVLFTALVHPYMVLFALGLCFATLLKYTLRKEINLIQLIGYNIFSIASLLLTYYVVGNFMIPSDDAEGWGFGFYSANINCFFNSLGKCNLFPWFKIDNLYEGQYEGFAYLGGGILLLCLLAIVSYVKREKSIVSKYNIGPIALVAIGLFVFALSNKVSFNKQMLIELPYVGILKTLGGTFRASGRYVWMLHYLLFLWVIIWAAKSSLSKKFLYPLFFIALILQLVDDQKLLKRGRRFLGEYKPPLNLPIWNEIAKTGDKLIMYPPFSREYKHNGDYMYFCQLASDHDIPVSAGHLARFNKKDRDEYHQKLDAIFTENDLKDEQNAIFITTQKHSEQLAQIANLGLLSIYKIDEYIVGIPQHFNQLNQFLKSNTRTSNIESIKKESLSEFIKNNIDKNLLLYSWKKNKLQNCEDAVTLLDTLGFSVRNLKEEANFVGLLENGTVLLDSIHDNKQIILYKNDLAKICRKKPAHDFDLVGKGYPNGYFLEFKTKKDLFKIEKFDLTILVLDDNFELLESAYFNTRETCWHYRVLNVY